MSPVLLTDLLEDLRRRQLPSGGWSYRRDVRQASLEPTCLALLALKTSRGTAWRRGLQFLREMQNPDGAWPAFEGHGGQGSWTTSLAVLTLHGISSEAFQYERGIHWLLRTKGREAHWFSKWRFRTFDRHARFNPDKFGWPWQPDTSSWVVPTAFSLLALKQWLHSSARDSNAGFRIERGLEMLLDRVCPDGGWNAGNGVVYGGPLLPHPDVTAVALMAFCGEKPVLATDQSLDRLERMSRDSTSSWSTAWSIMALTTHKRPASTLLALLFRNLDAHAANDASTLASAALAIESLQTPNASGLCCHECR